MLGNAIFARLSGDSGVSALVGSRIYPWGGSSETPVSPYILYQQVDAGIADARAVRGSATHFRTLQQIDLFTNTRTAADALARAVRAALDGVETEQVWGGQTIMASLLDSQIDGNFEEAPNLHRIIQQYRIIMKEG